VSTIEYYRASPRRGLACIIFALGAAPVLLAEGSSATVIGQVALGDAIVRGVDAEMALKSPPRTIFSVRADDEGIFKFTALPPGTYALTLALPQCPTLTLRSIQLTSGEQKRLPLLRLPTCHSGFGGHPAPEFLEEGAGNISGRVLADETRPLAGATVRLLCDARKVCGETKTDSVGDFIFFNLPPRDDCTTRVTHPRFYVWEGTGFESRAGFDSTYLPITLDSKLQPKPPLIVCE
jgi:hypothetical protein